MSQHEKGSFPVSSRVGKYSINFRNCIDSNGNLDMKEVISAQRKTAIDIILNEKEPTQPERREYVNFFCNISGMKGKKLAEMMHITTPQLSQWRRNESKDISNQSWAYICVFFGDLFKNDGKVTNPWFSQEKISRLS